MSLLCGKNPALEALKSVQDSIKTALASKKAGLATLTGKLAEAKSKAEALVASLPNLSSFQAELAALAGATPEQIAQFKAKWDGKVAELDSFISKVTGSISDLANLDFCKDVPNVKLDPSTGETVEEAKEAQTPSVTPPPAEPVQPTVVAKSESVSSGESGVIPNEIEVKWRTTVYDPYRETVYRPLQRKRDAALEAELELRSLITRENRSRTAFFGSNRHPRAGELDELKIKTAAAQDVFSIVVRYYELVKKEIFTDADPKTNIEDYSAKALLLVDPKHRQYMEDPLPWLNKVSEIMYADTRVVKDFMALRANQGRTGADT